MVGGGPFGLRAGAVDGRHLDGAVPRREPRRDAAASTRSTSCERYVRWYRDGLPELDRRAASTSASTTRTALRRFERTREPYPRRRPSPTRAGNGSLMRLAPVPLFYAADPDEAIERVGRELAHDARRRRRASTRAATSAALIVGGRAARRRRSCSTPAFVGRTSPLAPGGRGGRARLVQAARAARDQGHRLRRPDARGRALGVRTARTSFRDGRAARRQPRRRRGHDRRGLRAARRGAYYGEDGIPAEWRERLALRETIERLADALYEAAWP